MDIAPEDRAKIYAGKFALRWSRWEFRPESSHHEEGPGQNEIDFRYSDPLTAADNTLTFKRW